MEQEKMLVNLNNMKKDIEDLKKQVFELKSLKEDLEFARSVEEAWKEYERGEFISVDRKDLAKELKKW